MSDAKSALLLEWPRPGRLRWSLTNQPVLTSLMYFIFNLFIFPQNQLVFKLLYKRKFLKIALVLIALPTFCWVLGISPGCSVWCLFLGLLLISSKIWYKKTWDSVKLKNLITVFVVFTVKYEQKSIPVFYTGSFKGKKLKSVTAFSVFKKHEFKWGEGVGAPWHFSYGCILHYLLISVGICMVRVISAVKSWWN